jgi:hypothetical protein
MARHLAEVGLKARYQPMTDTSGNVLAELRGSGGGASLMLYAPIDTHLDLTEAESEWTGARGEADMQPRPGSTTGCSGWAPPTPRPWWPP